MNVLGVQKFHQSAFANLNSKKANLHGDFCRFENNFENKINEDVFEHSNPKQVSFNGQLPKTTLRFEEKFNKVFFRKLANEHLPCAYTGIEMISAAQISKLKDSHIFSQNSPDVIKELKKFEQSLFPVEKEVFQTLEELAKTHPDKNLQELLKIKFPEAEKSLIQKQTALLNDINMEIRSLPKDEYLELRNIIQESFDKIFEPHPKPEDRFRRKALLYKLRATNISDQKVKDNITKIAEKLPNSQNSVDAFIVKYSEPYRIRFEYKVPHKIPQNDEEIVLRLLEPAFASDEHIYPQTLYNAARKKNQNINQQRITILTSKFINEQKKDTLFDDFAQTSQYDVATNVQNHINKLIKINQKWLKQGKTNDAKLLADYILLLKEEFQRRSKIVDIDISELDETLSKLESLKSATSQ